jgi:putative FmdB family regulatory protein
MPNYDYRCGKCDTAFERYHPLAEYDADTFCHKCGQIATKVLSCNIHGDEAAWINSTTEFLCKEGEEPITSRKQYKEKIIELGVEPLG